MSLLNTDPVHLARLRDHYAQHGALPSYAGLSRVVGFKAKTSAVKLAQRLMAAGFLQAAPGGKLAPTQRFFELPSMDAPVRAGAADFVDQQLAAEAFTLEALLVDSPSTTVLIRVKGDSMRDVGILDGDFAVVDRARSANAGDFVVALLDGKFTLKELRFEGRQPVLTPHNPAYPALRPGSGLEIYGVVRGIARRYSCGASKRPQRKIAGLKK
jgi:repressor LexA